MTVAGLNQWDPMPVPIKTLIALLLFLAVGAIAGGSVILSDPSGAFAQMSPRDLAGSPFPDFFMPGLVLLIVLGFGSALAAFLLWKLPGRVSGSSYKSPSSDTADGCNRSTPPWAWPCSRC